MSIHIEAGAVVIEHLRISDPAVVDLLAAVPPPGREAELLRALGVGARGVASMGVGVSVSEVGDRVRSVLEEVTAGASRHVAGVVDEARRALTDLLDPDRRDSVTARTVRDLDTLRAKLEAAIDVERTDSHVGRMLGKLSETLGPGGELHRTLDESLDFDRDGSRLGRVMETLRRDVVELREAVAREDGRAEERAAGTAKGVDFEDLLEAGIRAAARRFGDCAVERTARLAGSDGFAGDFVVTLPTGERIVIEAKNSARIDLTGSGGILAELDRARDNRRADVAVCVSALPVYPAEVGVFGVYDDRVLVVDDGSGDLLEVGLRWAAMLATTRRDGTAGWDVGLVRSRLDRIRDLGTRVASIKRSLSGVRSSVDGLRNELDGLRIDLLDLVEEARAELARHPGRPDTQVA